jgi:hypothetical protein
VEGRVGTGRKYPFWNVYTKWIVYPTRNLSIEVARQVTSASIDGRRHQSLALPPVIISYARMVVRERPKPFPQASEQILVFNNII